MEFSLELIIGKLESGAGFLGSLDFRMLLNYCLIVPGELCQWLHCLLFDENCMISTLTLYFFYQSASSMLISFSRSSIISGHIVEI